MVKLSPKVLNHLRVDNRMISDIDTLVSGLVVGLWRAPREDIAFSAEELIYVRGEADVQIEIRYTAGHSEYGQGEIFDPSIESQKQLVDAVCKAVTERISLHQLSCSAWTKPYYTGVFKM